MQRMGKKPRPQPVAPPKKDPNKIVVEAPAERNPVEHRHIQDRAHGTGGAGAHQDRVKDVEEGRSRKEKHKKNPRDLEAATLRITLGEIARRLKQDHWTLNRHDQSVLQRTASFYEINIVQERNTGTKKESFRVTWYTGNPSHRWDWKNVDTLREAVALANEVKPEADRIFAEELGESAEGRLASYSGNPDGQPIYPHEIAHGYGEPLAGGTDVMRRLQNNLLYEQGNTDQMRPESPKVASSGNDHDACVQFLDANMIRMGKRDSAWWLPAHNFGINMTMLGKLNLWVFTILPFHAQTAAYLPEGEGHPAGIVTHAIWRPHGRLKDDYPATAKNAEVMLRWAKQHAMVGDSVQREMKWIEDTFHIDIPTAIKTRWAQEAPKLAARRWSIDRLRVKDRFIPLDGGPAQDMTGSFRAASVRVACRYCFRGGC